MSDLWCDFFVIRLSIHMIFLPFNESWRLTHWRFSIDNPNIFWPHDIMPHLINIEDTSGDLVCFSKHNTVCLKTNVVPNYRLFFEHFLSLNIRRLISNHPRGSKFWCIANVNILTFLNCHFSAQSDWVNCKPSINSTNYSDWKSIFLL